jgi:hypothetical protein
LWQGAPWIPRLPSVRTGPPFLFRRLTAPHHPRPRCASSGGRRVHAGVRLRGSVPFQAGPDAAADAGRRARPDAGPRIVSLPGCNRLPRRPRRTPQRETTERCRVRPVRPLPPPKLPQLATTRDRWLRAATLGLRNVRAEPVVQPAEANSEFATLRTVPQRDPLRLLQTAATTSATSLRSARTVFVFPLWSLSSEPNVSASPAAAVRQRAAAVGCMRVLGSVVCCLFERARMLPPTPPAARAQMWTE